MLPEGHVVLFTLGPGLPMHTTLAIAISTGAELGALGYTGMTLLSDGTNRVVARPPRPSMHGDGES